MPSVSKFAIFDGKVTKKREKCKRKTRFSFHFRVQCKFGEAKVTKSCSKNEASKAD